MPPLRTLFVMVALCGILAEAAGASTVRIQAIYDKPVHVADGIYFRAAPGEANDLTIERQGDVVSLTDRVPLVPGPGCEAVSAQEVRCTLTPQITFVLDARLGDSDDAVRVGPMDSRSVELLGGPGDDDLVAPANEGASFTGGPGNDLMEGGTGTDVFNEEAARNGSDTMIGGTLTVPQPFPSNDFVDYGRRRHPVRVSLNGVRDDGEAGERDQVGADVEDAVTGSAGDVLLGNAFANRFGGGAGRDLLRGGAGDDYLVGDEYLARPKRQDDLIRGGSGDDHIEGGLGADRVSGGSGHDSIVAGPGADRLRIEDGVLDAVLCGPQGDRVLNDPSDFLAEDCERHSARVPARVVPLFWADGGDRLFLVLGCPFHHGVTCKAEATLEVEGQVFGPRSFSLAPGRYAWLLLSLGERTLENPTPPLDGGVVVLTSADARGRVATVRVPLSAVHRDLTEASFFLPPVLPFL